MFTVVLPVDILSLNYFTDESAEGSSVQIMHQTVREFFRSGGPTAHSMFQMDSNDAHIRISATCIQYLLLCIANTSSIDHQAGRNSWKPESFEACARYLNRRPFFNYALGYIKKHLVECSQVVRVSELASELCTKLNESQEAGYIFGNWIPQDWDRRIATDEELGHGKHFRAELLHAAARMKYSRVVEGLLIAGAEVDACLDGKTPLIISAQGGDAATAKVLLDQRAAIGAQDGDKRTALHLAAANGHNTLTGLLIDRGADREAKDEMEQTALHLAAANGHNLVAELLVDQGCDKEAGDRQGQTALHLAAANGHNPTIRLLIDKGAIKEARDGLGWGTLHTAAWSGHEPTVQLLVQILGAGKEERDTLGWTLLHVSVVNGHHVTSQWLIEHLDVDIRAKDHKGWTALHFAAALGLKDTVLLLLGNLLDVDRGARNQEGNTALDLAQE